MPGGFDLESLRLLDEAATRLAGHHASLPSTTGQAAGERSDWSRVLTEVADRMADNFPYQHPLYAGQMLKPPHPVARMAYALAMFVNPNNHALDGGRASSEMEREAVAQIAGMLGFEQHLGHLTGGGTMANLEALWIAARLHPGGRILASEQAHYTHARLCEVLGIPFEAVATDASGRMDPVALAEAMDAGPVAAVVATLGTTGLGAVDPLKEILTLARERGNRVHADAAYGGYFRLLGPDLGAPASEHLAAVADVDSVVIDPHKHGLQAYGCGCVLFADPAVGRFYVHDSPYTYFSSADLHLGEISLECSRPGAAAVALWATQRLLPLVPGGAFAESLARSPAAARDWATRLRSDARFRVICEPELDILVFAPLPAAGSDAEAISRLSQAVFETAAAHDLHLALIRLPATMVLEEGAADPDATVTCLRTCLMKPEHLDWVPELHRRLGEAWEAATR